MKSTVTVRQLLDHYDVFLIDAYGVLVHADGSFGGAQDFISQIEALGKTFLIVTNDASRLPETTSSVYSTHGVAIAPKHILTSGMLIEDFMAKERLSGSRCVVLGPSDSRKYVERAGGIVVDPDRDGALDVLFLCDEAGFPFLDTIDETVTMLVNTLAAGKTVRLVLPNPDILYPKGGRGLGVAAGAIAGMFDTVLRHARPDDPPQFIPLGKPHAPIFDRARAMTGSGKTVMIGDQLQTDILGASRCGIDSVLVGSGVSYQTQEKSQDSVTPTFLLASLKNDDQDAAVPCKTPFNEDCQ
jgi:HAD superfamily hydrolase (TIGR01459 family)